MSLAMFLCLWHHQSFGLLERWVIPDQERFPANAFIMDGMVLLNALKQIPPAFKELTESIMKLFFRQADSFEIVSTVEFVCDQYTCAHQV